MGNAVGRAMDRLGSAQGAAAASRRKESRFPVQAVAQLSSLDGEHARVAIGDVSTHGCSVRCVSGWLRAGRFVGVGLDDEQPLRAIVRWVREDMAGLEFLRPIPSDRREWQALMGWNY